MCFSISPTTDIFNGLIPTAFSVVVIIIGLFIQWRMFKKQITQQETNFRAQLKHQKADFNTQISEQRKLNGEQLKLSIQQTILTLSIDKAKDCNKIWQKQDDEFIEKYSTTTLRPWHYSKNKERYYDTVSELVISVEIITNAFSLFGNTSDYFSYEHRQKYIYAFWKQLRTEIRGFVLVVAINMIIELDKIANAERDNNVATFGGQIKSFFEFVKGTDLENRPNNETISKFYSIVAKHQKYIDEQSIEQLGKQ